MEAENRPYLAGCAQMHRFYNLPGGAAAGIADAKLPDMQAGWEQATSNVMAGLSGPIWFTKQLECTHLYWASVRKFNFR